MARRMELTLRGYLNLNAKPSASLTEGSSEVFRTDADINQHFLLLLRISYAHNDPPHEVPDRETRHCSNMRFGIINHHRAAESNQQGQ
jgi:hypothetical protein